jgi:hypothetical protein
MQPLPELAASPVKILVLKAYSGLRRGVAIVSPHRKILSVHYNPA